MELKVKREEMKKKKQQDEPEVEKVLQPILEQIQDETEGLLL